MKIATKFSCMVLGAMATAAWTPVATAQAPASGSPEPVTITTPSAPQGAGSNMASVSKADRKLYVELAEGNLAEIAAGKQTLAKSTDAQVTRFAQHMIDDHGASMKKLSELADRKRVELPATPDEKHRKQAERMADLSPIDFNTQYAKAAVADHRATLKRLDKIAKKAEDPDLKALAEKMRPTVEAHLKMAMELTAGTSR